MIRRTGLILLIFFPLTIPVRSFLAVFLSFFLAFAFFLFQFFAALSSWLCAGIDAGIVDRVSFLLFCIGVSPFFGDGHRDKGM